MIDHLKLFTSSPTPRGIDLYDNRLVLVATGSVGGIQEDLEYHEFGDQVVVNNEPIKPLKRFEGTYGPWPPAYVEIRETCYPWEHKHVFRAIDKDTWRHILTITTDVQKDLQIPIVMIPIKDHMNLTPQLWYAKCYTKQVLDSDRIDVEAYLRALYLLFMQHYDCIMQELSCIYNKRTQERLLPKFNKLCTESDIFTGNRLDYHNLAIFQNYTDQFGHQCTNLVPFSQLHKCLVGLYLDQQLFVQLLRRSEKWQLCNLETLRSWATIEYKKAKSDFYRQCKARYEYYKAIKGQNFWKKDGECNKHTFGSLIRLFFGIGLNLMYVTVVRDPNTNKYYIESNYWYTPIDEQDENAFQTDFLAAFEQYLTSSATEYLITRSSRIVISCEDYLLKFAFYNDNPSGDDNAKKNKQDIYEHALYEFAVDLLPMVDTLPIFDKESSTDDPFINLGGWDKVREASKNPTWMDGRLNNK